MFRTELAADGRSGHNEQTATLSDSTRPLPGTATAASQAAKTPGDNLLSSLPSTARRTCRPLWQPLPAGCGKVRCRRSAGLLAQQRLGLKCADSGRSVAAAGVNPARYALLASLRAPEAEVDLYNAIVTELGTVISASCIWSFPSTNCGPTRRWRNRLGPNSAPSGRRRLPARSGAVRPA